MIAADTALPITEMMATLTDPRSLFALAVESAPLRAALLSGVKCLRPTYEVGGQVGGISLFCQWELAEKNGWTARIHAFNRDDPDDPHNHAWEWRSLVLETGYWDIGADGTRTWRAPGDVIVEDGTRFHRVALESGQRAWTLFLHGPKVRAWGFLADDGGVVPLDRYVSRAGGAAGQK